MRRETLPASCLRRAARLAPAAALTAVLLATAGSTQANDLAIVSRHVDDGSGGLPRPAMVLIRDGLIAAIWSVDASVPAGVPVLDALDHVVVPGFIDARSGAGLPPWANEEGTEVSPALSPLDLVDPGSPDFEVALRSGVTTVALAPGGRAVFGGTVAVVKTDDRPLDARVVRREAGVVLTLGIEPSMGNRIGRFQRPEGLYFRRPGNRMGVMSEARRAFGSAAGGPATDVLARALRHDLPVFVRARTESDIRGALSLAREFGFRPVLVDPIEGHRTLAALAAAEVPCILGPFYNTPRQLLEAYEGEDMRPALPSLMTDAGLTVALGSGPDESPASVRDAAMHAVRHGLAPAAALAAITRVPAGLLGVSDRVGRLAVGLDADIVILDQDPLSPAARILAVVVEGRVAFRDPLQPAEASRQEPAP